MDCRLRSLEFDFATAAGWYSAIAGVLAGFAFLAILLPLDHDQLPEPEAVAVGCSASFLTPISTPGNLMIMGAGGYEFGDYWRLGLPMLACSS